MNTPSIVVLSTVLAAGAAFTLVELIAPPQPVAPPPEAGTADLDALVRNQESTARQLEKIAQRLDALEARGERVRPEPVDAAVVEAAVRKVLADNDGSTVSSAAPPKKADPELSFDTVFAQLSDASMAWDAKRALWSKAREAGMMDELVAAFEARAKADPDNPEAHVDLGSAYLQKMFGISNDMEKGVLANKADRAFTEALDINPKHWGARFAKAVSLSFWPAFLGRGPEATKNFEILVEQQESSGTKKPEYAQTYVYLGNLYEQRGETEKASKMWQRGLALFPQNSELQGKVK